MSFSMPLQRLPMSKKDEDWRRLNVDYFERLSFISANGNRSSNRRKLINYDLFNGRFNKADLEYVCNPLGLKDNEFPATLQHYDIISPAINALMGEEDSRPDNCMVISEGPDAVKRKSTLISNKVKAALEADLRSTIDPKSVDPNNPPPKPEQVAKYEKYSSSDLLEQQANKILKFLKRRIRTKDLFIKGWKDALIAGEEIYWNGIVNGEPMMRRCNPPDMSIILNGDSDFIDDAVAIIEVRMLSLPAILDEYGDVLTPEQITKLEDVSRGFFSRSNTASHESLILTPDGTDVSSNTVNNFSQYGGMLYSGNIKVVRVEWLSLKKIGFFTHLDENTGQQITDMVDETFKISKDEIEALKAQGIDEPISWTWINEAWEGTKIANEIYIDMKPKFNQRKRLDNPYRAFLGYSGMLYNATNSISISLVDRMKPFQYLYNIIMYRLELAFASDLGKVMLMDLAQIPQSEGIDIEKWMYYLRAMKIAFINSHEEGRKGAAMGKYSTFNQFQSIDLSLSTVIQQYINTLEYIKKQIFFISGVDLTRLGQSSPDAGLGTTQTNLQQSANITRNWVEWHNSVKEKAYTALIECAKIAYRKGFTGQLILDDMSTELLTVEGPEFENQEYAVFVSASSSDQKHLEDLKKLFESAIQQDKVALSDIAEVISSQSIADISRLLRQREDEKNKSSQQVQQQTEQMQKQMHDEKLDLENRKLELEKYKIDKDNETKLETAAISASKGMDQPVGPTAEDMEELDIKRQQVEATKEDIKLKHDRESNKHLNDKTLKHRELDLKEKEIAMKKDVEKKKTDAEDNKIKTQKEIEELKAKTQLKVAAKRPKPK